MVAAMRRGWVTPILARAAAPIAKLGQPSAAGSSSLTGGPATMTAWWAAMAAVMSSTLLEMGGSGEAQGQ